MEIIDPGLDLDHVSFVFISFKYLCLSIQLILGSRSRSPKERDTRRYPPRDETNGDSSGGSYPRRPRYNEGK